MNDLGKPQNKTLNDSAIKSGGGVKGLQLRKNNIFLKKEFI